MVQKILIQSSLEFTLKVEEIVYSHKKVYCYQNQ